MRSPTLRELAQECVGGIGTNRDWGAFQKAANPVTILAYENLRDAARAYTEYAKGSYEEAPAITAALAALDAIDPDGAK